MADVAYERVSTDKQSTERQRYVLTETGTTFARTFSDPATSSRMTPTSRQGFSELMTYVREGDTVHISEMFRLVRSVRDILDVLDLFHSRGLFLKIHDGAFSSIDLTARNKNTGELDSSVKFFVQCLAAAGEFQRDLQRELTIDGVRAAEAAGRKGGRKPALSEQDAEAARTAHQNSGRSIASLAREYSVSRVAIRTALGLDAAPVAEGAVSDRGTANVREVSKILRAAGYRPRNGESMNGRGGYWAHQDGTRVRVSHRFGPEGDDMPETVAASSRAELHDDYARVLAEAGYPVAARESGAPVTIDGAKVTPRAVPTTTIAMPGALADHVTESMRAAGPEAAKSPEYAPLVAAMASGQTVRRGKGYALTLSAPEEVLSTIDGFAESIMFGNTVTPDSVKRAARQWKERRTA